MKRLLWIGVLAATMLLGGCEDEEAAKPTPVVLAGDGRDITITLKAETPNFKRTYDVVIKARGLRMEIETRYFLRRVWYDGTLRQSDGKWATFDPQAPADRIFDRDILPEVEARCREILALDSQWRDAKPAEFTDESGQVWVRR